MLTEHRVKVKSGEYISGTRDGQDEEIVNALNTYAEEEDEIQQKKDATHMEGVEMNWRKEARAAKVCRWAPLPTLDPGFMPNSLDLIY